MRRIILNLTIFVFALGLMAGVSHNAMAAIDSKGGTIDVVVGNGLGTDMVSITNKCNTKKDPNCPSYTIGATFNINGVNADQFTITGGNCPGKPIGPSNGNDGKCDIDVQCGPLLAGQFGPIYTANLNIPYVDNNGASNVLTVPLVCNGIGCGDGKVNNGEACDPRVPDSVGCCSSTCLPTNQGSDCFSRDGGCTDPTPTPAACNNGTCEGGSGASNTTTGNPCTLDVSDGGDCFASACDASNNCVAGAPSVVCPSPAPSVCEQGGECVPATGDCSANSALPANTSCGSGDICDGDGNCITSSVASSTSTATSTATSTTSATSTSTTTATSLGGGCNLMQAASSLTGSGLIGWGILGTLSFGGLVSALKRRNRS